MAFGLSDQGFQAKRLADIKAELEQTWRSKFGDNVRVDAESPDGQIIGIMAEREALIWELCAKIYSSSYSSSARGVQLDRLHELVAISRLAAKSSTVDVTLTGTPSTVIPAGSKLATADTGAKFSLSAGVTIGGGGTVTGAFVADNTGPIQALSGTLTVIVTPVAGWTSATNPLDADVGRNVETDAQFSARKSRLLSTVAGCSAPAIFAALAKLADVEEVLIIENRSTAPDFDGRPGCSIECVVKAGDQQEILDTLWALKPGGAQAYGSTSGIVIDRRGDPQTLAFSRPTDLPLYVEIDLIVDDRFPANGLETVRDAVLAFGLDEFTIGRRVIPFEMVQRIDTAGIVTLTIRVGTSNPPVSGEPFAIAKTQIAKLDSSRVTVRRIN